MSRGRTSRPPALLHVRKPKPRTRCSGSQGVCSNLPRCSVARRSCSMVVPARVPTCWACHLRLQACRTAYTAGCSRGPCCVPCTLCGTVARGQSSFWLCAWSREVSQSGAAESTEMWLSGLQLRSIRRSAVAIVRAISGCQKVRIAGCGTCSAYNSASGGRTHFNPAASLLLGPDI